MEERLVASPYLWVHEIKEKNYLLNALNMGEAVRYSPVIKNILMNFESLNHIPEELSESIDLINELVKKRYLLKESSLLIPVLNLELEITNYCNAKCKICPRNNLTRGQGFMEEDTFKNVIKQLKVMPVNEVEICGVGEPILHKNIVKYVQELKNIKINKVRIVSNGSLLDKKLCDDLVKAGLDEISISFNKIDKESYEEFMEGLSYDKVLRNISYLVENYNDKVNIIITSVISEEDKGKKKDFIDFWKSRNVDNVRFQYLQSRAGTLYNAGKINQQLRCPVFEQGLFITWDGNYLSCSNDFQGVSSSKNIKTTSFKDYLEYKNKRINNSNMFGFCSNCDYDFRKVTYLKSDFYKHAKYKE